MVSSSGEVMIGLYNSEIKQSSLGCMSSNTFPYVSILNCAVFSPTPSIELFKEKRGV